MQPSYIHQQVTFSKKSSMNHLLMFKHKKVQDWEIKRRETETELKNWAPVILLTKRYDWPQPAAEFGPSQSNIENISSHDSPSHAQSRLMRCYREEDAAVDVWVKRPQVTSTPHFLHARTSPAYSCVPLDVQREPLRKKKKKRWIYFLLCVSFTLPWLNSCHAWVFHLLNGDCWDTLTFISDKWLILCLTGSRRPPLTFRRLRNGVFFHLIWEVWDDVREPPTRFPSRVSERWPVEGAASGDQYPSDR